MTSQTNACDHSDFLFSQSFSICCCCCAKCFIPSLTSWKNITFTVESSNTSSSANDAADLQQWLTSSYVLSPPTDVPSSLLYPSIQYSITVELCNFLDACGTSVHQVMIVTTIKPVAKVFGKPMRAVYRPDIFRLSSSASISQCGDGDGEVTTTTQGLQYFWTVYRDGVADPNIISISKESQEFMLAPYTLKVGTTYEVELRVYSTKFLTEAKTFVSVTILYSDLVANIDGAQERGVKPSQSLVLDGSTSFDMDTDLSVATAEEVSLVAQSAFNYTWTCTQL